MPPPHRPDVPCEEQELPNLHAPGGPIPAFPVLEHSPGSDDEAAGSDAAGLRASSTRRRTFVDDVLPLVAEAARRLRPA